MDIRSRRSYTLGAFLVGLGFAASLCAEELERSHENLDDIRPPSFSVLRSEEASPSPKTLSAGTPPPEKLSLFTSPLSYDAKHIRQIKLVWMGDPLQFTGNTINNLGIHNIINCTWTFPNIKTGQKEEIKKGDTFDAQDGNFRSISPHQSQISLQLQRELNFSDIANMSLKPTEDHKKYSLLICDFDPAQEKTISQKLQNFSEFKDIPNILEQDLDRHTHEHFQRKTAEESSDFWSTIDSLKTRLELGKGVYIIPLHEAMNRDTLSQYGDTLKLPSSEEPKPKVGPQEFVGLVFSFPLN